MIRPQDNPFRMARIDALPYLLTGEAWTTIDARFARAGERAAVVGPHGSGKTTFLSTFAARLRDAGRDVRMHRLRRDDPRIPARFVRDLQPGTVLVLDSAGCLGLLAWRRFVRTTRGASLLVSAHRRGRLPVLHRPRPDAATLGHLLDRLDPRAAERWRPHLAALLVEHHGNARDVFRTLYDLARRAESGTGATPAGPTAP